MDVVSIGIDQGLANIGYSIIKIVLDENDIEQDIKIVKSGTLQTSSKKELQNRLVDIYDMIKALNGKYNANIVGCEKLFFNPVQKGTGRNKSASIMVTNMVSGVIFLLAGNENILVKDFTPGTVKKYVAGNGRATKDEVINAVADLCIKEGIVTETDHQADAIAIGVTTGRYYVNTLIPLVKATNGVERAEASMLQEDLDIAKKLVSLLENSQDKVQLNKRVDKLKTQLEKVIPLRNATIEVEKAEMSKLQEDIDIAKEIVSSLPGGKNKTALNKRLNAVIRENKAKNKTMITKAKK